MHKNGVKEATVCHLIRGEGDGRELLLGRRNKTLFANGIWNGPGGKLRKSETIRRCASREVGEEIGVRANARLMKHFASVDFHHLCETGHEHKWRVHFFRTREWEGEPQPLDGLDMVEWFPMHRLPYANMMGDQRVWLPMVLDETETRLLVASIYYADIEQRKVAKGEFKFL